MILEKIDSVKSLKTRKIIKCKPKCLKKETKNWKNSKKCYKDK